MPPPPNTKPENVLKASLFSYRSMRSVVTMEISISKSVLVYTGASKDTNMEQQQWHGARDEETTNN